MSNTTFSFRNHGDFHRAALQMAVGGGMAGLVGYLCCSRGSTWALGLVAVAAVLGALSPGWSLKPRQLAIRTGLVVAAAAALILLGHLGEVAAGVGAFAVLFGGALAWGSHGRRLLLAIAAGAGIAVLGRHVFGSISTAQELSSLPGWLVGSLAGISFSFLSVVALLPRHIFITPNPVADAYEGLSNVSNGEVRELVNRGYGLWVKSADNLVDSDPHRRTIEEGVLRLFEVARRWNASEAESAPKQAASLVDRMTTLDARIEATTDKVAREQYVEAKAALAEQLRYIKEIGTSRERVLARMHNYLAAMERLRMAVINLESANASRDAVQPLLTDVEELGRDIVSCSQAMAEADHAVAADAPATEVDPKPAVAAEMVAEAVEEEAAEEEEKK